jgi:hypothetical protein
MFRPMPVLGRGRQEGPEVGSFCCTGGIDPGAGHPVPGRSQRGGGDCLPLGWCADKARPDRKSGRDWPLCQSTLTKALLLAAQTGHLSGALPSQV